MNWLVQSSRTMCTWVVRLISSIAEHGTHSTLYNAVCCFDHDTQARKWAQSPVRIITHTQERKLSGVCSYLNNRKAMTDGKTASGRNGWQLSDYQSPALSVGYKAASSVTGCWVLGRGVCTDLSSGAPSTQRVRSRPSTFKPRDTATPPTPALGKIACSPVGHRSELSALRFCLSALRPLALHWRRAFTPRFFCFDRKRVRTQSPSK